jgi:hypothetical protein
MPPNKQQSNYSKRPVKRIRILKIGPRKSKSLFEEYFYGFLVAICLAVMILGKAGGLSGYDAVVTGLWVGGFVWCAWVLRRYRKERGSPGRMEKSKQAMQPRGEMIAKPLSPNFKPMIGPQWPLKSLPGSARPIQRSARPAQEPIKPAQAPGPASQTPAAPSNPNKQVFVYERPTLPDRPPKFPANWAGQQGKKPKK